MPPEMEESLEKCLKDHGEALISGALTDTMVMPLLRPACCGIPGWW